jgi:hypothetical protein
MGRSSLEWLCFFMLLDSARFVPAAHLDILYAAGILAPVYGRFTEGFAIADMRTMRAPLDSLPQRLPQRSFARDAMRAKFALCPGLLSPTGPGKSGRYMNQEDGVPASFVHSIFLTYPRVRAYVAANRSPVASILGIIRAGRVPKQKTRLVRALWQMFQDI